MLQNQSTLSYPTKETSKCLLLVFEILGHYSTVEAVCWIVMAFVSCGLNLHVLVVIARITKITTSHDMYLISLFSSHLLTSCFVLPIYAKMIWSRLNSCILKQTHYLLVRGLLIVCLLSIFAISIDRLRKIKSKPAFPMHNQNFSYKKPLAVIIGIWIFCAGRSYLLLLNDESESINIPPIDLVIVLLAIVVLYYRIVKNLKKLKQNLSDTSTVEMSVATKRYLNHHEKVIRLMTLLLVVFVITWSPVLIVNMVENVIGNSYVMTILTSVTTKLLLVSTLIDPFVYFWITPKHRRIFRTRSQQSIELRDLGCNSGTQSRGRTCGEILTTVTLDET